jgi:hypothetical protein
MKAWLPDTFDLEDIFSGAHRTVRLVWAGLAGVGVRFLDASRKVARRTTGFGRH